MAEAEEETEPYLDDVIDEAVGPFAALLPPDELIVLRRALRDAAKDDPELGALYRAGRPRPAPATSGEKPSDPRTAASQEARPALPLRRKGGAA